MDDDDDGGHQIIIYSHSPRQFTKHTYTADIETVED